MIQLYNPLLDALKSPVRMPMNILDQAKLQLKKQPFFS